MKHIAQRTHIVGFKENGQAIRVNTAEIPQRSLNCVGGTREGRRYTRRKKMPVQLNAMMLVAIASEIARRRRANKAAAKSRASQRMRARGK